MSLGENFNVKEVVDMEFNIYNFSKASIMQYTNVTFEQLFHEKIKLTNYSFSEQQGGYFVLVYEYSPMGYEICFEHERLLFSIRITRKDGTFTSANQICGGKIKNTLNQENIYNAIEILSSAIIENKIIFYKIQKGRQIEVGD